MEPKSGVRETWGAGAREPECRIRINLSKNTKGWNWDTTVEMSWIGTPSVVMASMATDETPARLLERLNRLAASQAREEIARREKEDSLTLSNNGRSTKTTI